MAASLAQKIAAAAAELAFVVATDALLAPLLGPGTFARHYYGDGGFGDLIGGGGGAKPPSGFGASGRLAPRKHAGGLVGGGGNATVVPASYFAGAPRYHAGGLVGADERVIIAQTGERVLSRDETRAYDAARGGKVTVNIVNNGAPASAQVRETGDGRDRIIDVVLESIEDGAAGKIIENNYGLQRRAA